MRPITPSGTRTLPLVLALVAATLLLPLASTASAATPSARATVNASQGQGAIPATAFGINTAVYQWQDGFTADVTIRNTPPAPSTAGR